nr:uncharacterized protein LOC108950312 [Ciona intestinalis]|eukprot:XP_018671296.2 uncharacterized protein LOC108950312 [Ciona intestinalis]
MSRFFDHYRIMDLLTSNRDAKTILDRLNIDLNRKLRLIEIAKMHAMQMHDYKIKSIIAFQKSMLRHSGPCCSALPSSESEAKKIRDTFSFSPRMTFGTTDYYVGLTSRVARHEYCLNYDADYVIRRHNAKKKLTWPPV